MRLIWKKKYTLDQVKAAREELLNLYTDQMSAIFVDDTLGLFSSDVEKHIKKLQNIIGKTKYKGERIEKNEYWFQNLAAVQAMEAPAETRPDGTEVETSAEMPISSTFVFEDLVFEVGVDGSVEDFNNLVVQRFNDQAAALQYEQIKQYASVKRAIEKYKSQNE